MGKNHKNIRSSFTRYLKKKIVASGSGGADLLTSVEFQALDWLVSFTDHKETVTNLKRPHSHTEQANASPSNDNNLDIETAFSMTEESCANLFILDESYNNKNTPSTCTTDVKSVTGRLVTRKKQKLEKLIKLLKSPWIPSTNRSLKDKRKKGNQTMKLSCFALVWWQR